MSFRTRYDRIRKLSNTGSPYLDLYKQSVDDDGQIILIKAGRDNIHEKIQAERSSCELKQILARLSHDEISKFDITRGGMFGDFTQVPKSIRDMRQRMLDAEGLFATLPAEVKEQFDYSTDKFFSSIGSDYYNKVMSPFFDTPDLKEEIIKEDITE